MSEYIRVAIDSTQDPIWKAVRAIFDLFIAERLSMINELMPIRDVVPVEGTTNEFDLEILDGSQEDVASRLQMLPQVKVITR